MHFNFLAEKEEVEGKVFVRTEKGQKVFFEKNSDGSQGPEISFASEEEAWQYCKEQWVIGEVYPETNTRIIESGPTTVGYSFTVN